MNGTNTEAVAASGQVIKRGDLVKVAHQPGYWIVDGVDEGYGGGTGPWTMLRPNRRHASNPQMRSIHVSASTVVRLVERS